MKKIFKEFYINEENLDMKNLNSETVIILDTNILLNLYVMSPELRERVLASLLSVESNLWMPYQIGYEFHMNRKNKTIQFRNTKKDYINKVESGIIEVLKKEREKLETSFSVRKDFITDYEDIYKGFQKDIENFVKKLKEKLFDESNTDPIILINKLYEGKVNKIDNNDYEQWEKEGIKRYEKLIPPGFEDKDKKGYLNFNKNYPAKYGDFFLWKEILEYSLNNNKKNVVFVTEDLKPDWFYETKGSKVGPRIELIKELLEFADAKLRVYRTETFLSFISNSEEDFNNEILDELREISKKQNNLTENTNESNLASLSQLTLFDVVDIHNNHHMIIEKINTAIKKINKIEDEIEMNLNMSIFDEELSSDLIVFKDELQTQLIITEQIVYEYKNKKVTNKDAKMRLQVVLEEVNLIMYKINLLK